MKLKNGFLTGAPKAADSPGAYPFSVTVFTHRTKTTPSLSATSTFTLTLS
jgi:hypothetical protein